MSLCASHETHAGDGDVEMPDQTVLQVEEEVNQHLAEAERNK